MESLGRTTRNLLVAFGLLAMSGALMPVLDAWIFKLFGWGADSTDSSEKRSGMALHRDALTGCEYLASPWGGITPRVNGRGEHMGCK